MSEAWPIGCRKPNACARHKACVYNCWRRDMDISAEIEAASAAAQPAAGRAVACVALPDSAAPAGEAEIRADERAKTTARIVAWLRGLAVQMDSRAIGKSTVRALLYRQAASSWRIAADDIERGDHEERDHDRS